MILRIGLNSVKLTYEMDVLYVELLKRRGPIPQERVCGLLYGILGSICLTNH